MGIDLSYMDIPGYEYMNDDVKLGIALGLASRGWPWRKDFGGKRPHNENLYFDGEIIQFKYSQGTLMFDGVIITFSRSSGYLQFDGEIIAPDQ